MTEPIQPAIEDLSEFQDEELEAVPAELAIAEFAPATDMQLATGLGQIRQQIYDAAQANLAAVGEGFTEIEQNAMLHCEALRQTNGLELATVLIRGEIIDTIVGSNLTTQHPNQYESLRDMARDQGISHSELSKTQVLCGVVFPYLRDILNVNVTEMWEQIGKSKFTDMLPYLRVLMTGEDSNSTQVNDTVVLLREEFLRARVTAGETEPMSEEAVNQVLVVQLLQEGALLPTRRLRERLRPERTPPIETVYLRHGDVTYVMARLSVDQVNMFEQRMHAHTSPQIINLSDNPQVRATEVAAIPLIRSLTELVVISDD